MKDNVQALVTEWVQGRELIYDVTDFREWMITKLLEGVCAFVLIEVKLQVALLSQYPDPVLGNKEARLYLCRAATCAACYKYSHLCSQCPLSQAGEECNLHDSIYSRLHDASEGDYDPVTGLFHIDFPKLIKIVHEAIEIVQGLQQHVAKDVTRTQLTYVVPPDCVGCSYCYRGDSLLDPS